MNGLLERGPVLHARARHLPAAAGVVLVVAVLAGVVDLWTDAIDPRYRDTMVRFLVVFPPLIAAVVLSSTLHGAAVDLERTFPRLSPRQRGARAVTTTALACLALAGAVALAPGGTEGIVLVRNTAGLLGTVLLTVTVLRPALAWLPAFLHAVFTFLLSLDPPPPSAVWWSYLVQPAGIGAPWVVAGALLVAGVLAYTARGPSLSVS